MFMWAKHKTCRILVRKPEGKRKIGRKGCRWENNIKNCVEGGGRKINLAV
jgi:hypothetical protein